MGGKSAKDEKEDEERIVHLEMQLRSSFIPSIGALWPVLRRTDTSFGQEDV